MKQYDDHHCGALTAAGTPCQIVTYEDQCGIHSRWRRWQDVLAERNRPTACTEPPWGWRTIPGAEAMVGTLEASK